MTRKEEEAPDVRRVEDFDRADYTAKTTAPKSTRKRRRSGRARCVCDSYGVQACIECRNIDRRRRAANERRSR